jgi:hypothetical protein
MIPLCSTPLVFVMNKQFVLCKVVAESLHISEERQVSKCSHLCYKFYNVLDPILRTHGLIHTLHLRYAIIIRNYNYTLFLLITYYYYYYLKNYIPYK